jgi:hypothetical protein
VAFSKSLESCIQPTLSRTDYSSAEKAATWYSAKDCYFFRLHCHETVKKLKEGQIIDGYTIRGLEGVATPEAAQQRFVLIREGIKAVLDEQALQELDGKEKPEMLAHIYRRYALRSQVAAYKRGLQDQQEALHEQALQELDGREKLKMLAHIYRRYALRSQVAAYKRGLEYQHEVLHDDLCSLSLH